MAGFEDLIRGALKKQGDLDSDGRQKVYESARAALERMLANSDSTTEQIAIGQRQRLEAAIEDIEATYASSDSALARARERVEFSPEHARPSPPVEPTAPVPSDPIDPPLRAERPGSPSGLQPGRVEPGFDLPSQRLEKPQTHRMDPVVAIPPQEEDAGGLFDPKPHRLDAEPGIDIGTTPAPIDAATEEPRRHPLLQERRPYARLLFWTILIVGLGIALWWAITFGPDLLRTKLDGAVPNPRPTLESGPYDPGGEETDGWISVFVPEANAQDVVTGGNGAAELQRDGSRSIMRMASPSGSAASNLLVKIPRGIMESLQGQAATFEVTIRAAASEAQEFTMFCEFSDMGSCGRKRFTATSSAEPFIFDVLINDTTLPSGEDAFLAINTDLAGDGRAIDLYSVRVRTGN